VAEDVNTQRAKQLSTFQSNANYKGTLRRQQEEAAESEAAAQEEEPAPAPVPVMHTAVRAPPAPKAAPAPAKPRYKALYSYDAEDADEVSFEEGDIIVDGEAIDEGWMNGTVERTGKRGMLPSNYVEQI
jgi:hypothetical protein